MTLINQGKPVSCYFPVALPGNNKIQAGESVKCLHPRTGILTKGICSHTYTILWAEVPDSYCFQSFGHNAIQLKNALEKSFPEFKESEFVKFLLIKET